MVRVDVVNVTSSWDRQINGLIYLDDGIRVDIHVLTIFIISQLVQFICLPRHNPD